jgi:hypothetical protein
VNRPVVPQQLAAPLTKAPEKKSSRLPDRVHGSFDSGKKVGHDYEKQFHSEFEANTPKLPSKGLLGGMGKVLGKLPKVGISKEFEKGVAVAKTEGSFGAANGAVSGGYSASVLEASVGGKGEVSFGHGAAKVNGEVHAQATLVDVQGHVKAKLGPAEASAQGGAYVGVKANAQGGVTVDPVHGIYGVEAKADAFAGAKAGISGEVSLGKYASVHGSVEGMAGVGIKVGASAKLEKGRLKFHFEFGAALGIGGKLSFGFDINFKKMADGIKKALNKPIEVAKDITKKVGTFFKEGAKKLGDGLKKTGEKLANGIKDAGHAIKDGFKDAGKALKKGFKKLKFW